MMRDRFNKELTMSVRKNGKLTRLIALAINLQLVITTSAFAKNDARDNKHNILSGLVGAVNQVGGAAMQGMQGMQMQQMQAQQQAMMQQQYGLSPVNPAQVPKILTDNGCLVLPARTNYPTDKCESYDPMQAENGYYTALMGVAQNNENDLTNYLTSGHERFTTQGVGCYEKAMKQFTAALNARISSLNSLEKHLDRTIDAFVKNTEEDRENIKRGNALLTGSPAKYLKDIKFQDKFQDPQCRSFMASANFNSSGKKGGFRGIQSDLETYVNKAKPQDFKGKQVSIKKDIKKIAKKVARQVKRKKVLNIDPTKLGIRSKHFKSSNSTLGAILQEASSDVMNDVADVQKELSKVVEDQPQLKKMIAGIESDSIDLDNALFNYERGEKNTCLNKYMKNNFGGVSGFTGKLKDPNISAKANRESDSAFKNELVAILGDDLKTIEEKITLIKKAEKKKGSSRWTMTTGKSVSIEGKTVGASTRLRASDMISIFTDNCSAKFDNQRNSKGKSSRSAMKALRNYKKQFKSLQNKFATTLEEKIISDMINCPNETTEGVGASSCTGALDTNNGSFCLRTANVCAGNMLACKDKADKIVETTRNEQKVLAKAYKTKVDVFKAQLAQSFVATNTFMEGQSRRLDGMYQLGSMYSVPMKTDLGLLVGKDTLLPEGEGFDSTLMLENPEAYRKKLKANIAELKKSVKAQNALILNGQGTGADDKNMIAYKGGGQTSKYKGLAGEIQKYQDNYNKQQGEWSKIASSCSKMIDNHNAAIDAQNAETAKADGEYNNKVGNICKKVQGYNSSPAGFCGEASSLGDDIFEISAVAGDSEAAANLKAFDQTCDSYGAEDTSNTVDQNFFGDRSGRNIASNTSPSSFCKKYKSEVPACNTIDTFYDKYGNTECSDSLENLAKKELKNKKVFVQYKIKKMQVDGTDTEVEDIDNVYKTYSSHPDCKNSGIKRECHERTLSSLPPADQKKYVSENDSQVMKDLKCYELDAISSSQVKKFEEAEETVSAYIAQGKRAKEYSDMGGLNVSFCNAGNDSMFGGKDMMNFMGQQPDRGLAGSGAIGW